MTGRENGKGEQMWRCMNGERPAGCGYSLTRTPLSRAPTGQCIINIFLQVGKLPSVFQEMLSHWRHNVNISES